MKSFLLSCIVLCCCMIGVGNAQSTSMQPVARGVMIPTESINGAFTYTYANATGVTGKPVQINNTITITLEKPLTGQPTIIATLGDEPYTTVPIVAQIAYSMRSSQSVTFTVTAITVEGKPYPNVYSEISFVIYDAVPDEESD